MIPLLLKLPKAIISAIYEKISESATKANMTVKDFLGKDENISHISLVVYDILPLVFKLGLRYDSFNSKFHTYFKHFRDFIYKYEESESLNKKTDTFNIEKHGGEFPSSEKTISKLNEQNKESIVGVIIEEKPVVEIKPKRSVKRTVVDKAETKKPRTVKSKIEKPSTVTVKPKVTRKKKTEN